MLELICLIVGALAAAALVFLWGEHCMRKLAAQQRPVLAPPADDGRFEAFAIEQKIILSDMANAVGTLTKTVQDYVIDFTDARRIELERHDKREKAWVKTLEVVDHNLTNIVSEIKRANSDYQEALRKWNLTASRTNHSQITGAMIDMPVGNGFDEVGHAGEGTCPQSS